MMKIEAGNLLWAAGPTTIVDGIGVPVMPSRILRLLGPNGSGKSTLLGMLTHTIQPRMGIVGLDDRPCGDWAPRGIARVLSVVQQKATTDQNITVYDVIDLGRIPYRRYWAGSSPRDCEVVEAAAHHTGTKHLPNHDWHTLSGSEQQRVHLARAFVQKGQVMLLDELTNHLDIPHQPDVLKILRETGLGVVATLHDLNLAITLCDEMLVLHKGRAMCLGRPVDVLAEDPICEACGVEVRVLHPDDDEIPPFRFPRPVMQT